jgi:hypothetical protein
VYNKSLFKRRRLTIAFLDELVLVCFFNLGLGMFAGQVRKSRKKSLLRLETAGKVESSSSIAWSFLGYSSLLLFLL